MIGIPFFLWLLFTLGDFGDFDQLFAFLAIIGLTMTFINWNKQRTFRILVIDIFCFLLLASPIVRRITAVPVVLFNYLAFILPTTIFTLFYGLSLLASCRYGQHKLNSI